MKLPNYENALISREKIADYLLSQAHDDGRHKAEFFMHFGFAPESWEALSDALLQNIADREVVRIEASPFGTRYVVEGIIKTPVGRTPLLRSVWFIRNMEETPRLVTAYPLSGRTDS